MRVTFDRFTRGIMAKRQSTLPTSWCDRASPKKVRLHEDPIGLCRVPDTKAETLFKVLKDLLIRCNLPLALCRGQAYDGAANMQGRNLG